MKINPVANFINNSKATQKILKGVNKNPAMFNAISSFALASMLRPTLIGVIPFKDKQDKQYSQASAVAAGLVELAATAAIFFPLNKYIAKASNQLYEHGCELYRNNAPILRGFKSITNRGIKVLSLIPISLLRFALVKPVVDVMFGRRNESK